MKSMIIINDKECWCCGSTEKITKHHAIPQTVKPLRNVIIPVCEECHSKKINRNDLAEKNKRAESILKAAIKRINMDGFEDAKKLAKLMR